MTDSYESHAPPLGNKPVPGGVKIQLRITPLPVGLALCVAAVFTGWYWFTIERATGITWSSFCSPSFPLAVAIAIASIHAVFTWYRFSVENGWVEVTRTGPFGHSTRRWTTAEVGHVAGPTEREKAMYSTSGRFPPILLQLTHKHGHGKFFGLTMLFHGGNHYCVLSFRTNHALDQLAATLNDALAEQRDLKLNFDASYLRMHPEPPWGVTEVETSDEVSLRIGVPNDYGTMIAYLLWGLGLILIGAAAWLVPDLDGRPIAMKHWAVEIGVTLVGLLGPLLIAEVVLASFRKATVSIGRKTLKITVSGLAHTENHCWSSSEISCVGVGERLSNAKLVYFPYLLVKQTTGKAHHLLMLHDEHRLIWIAARIRSYWEMQPIPHSDLLLTPEEKAADEISRFTSSPWVLGGLMVAIAIVVAIKLMTSR